MIHRFIHDGRPYEIDSDALVTRMSDVVPEAVRDHSVRGGGRLYPVKQVFAIATGLPRAQFTSHTARRHLAALGLAPAGFVSPGRSLVQPGTVQSHAAA
ncbi:hypothetical protein ACFQO7_34580 [Catellatospora aurea]|uniref:Uncharacterized protein n=1 Tax=Catellatospora aurea TaxID=1337874 RepID=A0ABW2HBB8_9ACTN